MGYRVAKFTEKRVVLGIDDKGRDLDAFEKVNGTASGVVVMAP